MGVSGTPLPVGLAGGGEGVAPKPVDLPYIGFVLARSDKKIDALATKWALCVTEIENSGEIVR